MKKSRFYLGIDSGGTNCRISLSDEKPTVLHTAVYSSVHYSEAGAAVFANYVSGNVKVFLKQFGFDMSGCKGLCAGVSGARTRESKDEIRKCLSECLNFENIAVESDTTIAFEDAFGEDDGLVLICGTGSAMFGRIKGKFVRLGGWGKILGDDGSSYFLGLNFLKRIVKYFDNYEERAEIEGMLEVRFGITRENIADMIYHQKFDIASLAPFIVEQAERGEALCKLVTDSEAENVLELFQSFFEKFNVKKKFNVAFTGSLIESDNYFSRTLKELLRLNFENKLFIKENLINPVNGALKTAIKHFR